MFSTGIGTLRLSSELEDVDENLHIGVSENKTIIDWQNNSVTPRAHAYCHRAVRGYWSGTCIRRVGGHFACRGLGI